MNAHESFSVRVPLAPAVLIVSAIVLSWAPRAHAILAGRVTSLQGDVTIRRVGELEGRIAARMSEVHVDDQIETGADGRVRILLIDDCVLNLAENSKLKITRQIYNPEAKQRESLFDLFRGRVRSVVSRYLNSQVNRFEVRTPTAVAGVRGSDQEVDHNESNNTTSVYQYSGSGYVTDLNGQNQTNINAGFFTAGNSQTGFSNPSTFNANEQGSGFTIDQSNDSGPTGNNNNGGVDFSPETNTDTTLGGSGPGNDGGGNQGGSDSGETLGSEDLPETPKNLVPVDIQPPVQFSRVRVVITLPN